MEYGPLVDPDDTPRWLRQLVRTTGELDPESFRRFSPVAPIGARTAAVLMLFGEQDSGSGPDVLLLRRAEDLGSHPGQVAFPGGGAEPGDDGPVGTALREAAEETGVQPEGVRPVALLPKLYVPVSKFLVTPVLAHWTTPSPVRAVDSAETAAVARVPIEHLLDPANRFSVRGPSGYVGPAFQAPGMLVWGFTAGLLTMLFSLAGWDRPWRADDVRDLDVAWASVDHEPPASAEVQA